MTPDTAERLNATLNALDYAHAAGLVTATGGRASAPDAELGASRGYLWRDLREKVGLDAAFFHDGVPLVGFSSHDDRGETGLLGLRKRLWNYGRVPLLINAMDHGFEVYNAVNRPITASGPSGALTGDVDFRSSIAGSLNEVFSRRSVEAGLFATQFARSFSLPDRVDQGLLANLRYLRKTIGGSDVQLRAGIDALVGASLTASYLADRGVLDAPHMTELCGFAQLDDVLSQGKQATLSLFAGLAQRFNGDVFGGLSVALGNLDDAAFHLVASLLRGDHLPSGQGALWPYDFKILPPDLVSSVYEQLLGDQQKQDSAYYTPRPVVDMVLDEVLPWGRTDVPTLIDLACGSGTFMTEAFRRLAFSAQRQASVRLSYPELQSLLVDHIYGIDQNATAARVAAFGLYLALLEEVDPPTIWQSVMLPALIGINIVVSDAFAAHSLRDKKFDIIVSNPPWTSKMSTTARSFVATRKVPVADNQMAQAFVWLAEDMLEVKGRLGLVLPAKSLLHNRSSTARQFRSALFRTLSVRVIVDLSPMRRSLFVSAIAPTAVLVAEKIEPGAADRTAVGGDGEILHVAVHPRPFASVAGALVISPEDLHVVSERQAVSRPDIWKVLVWGAPRDLDFIDHLRSRFPSLREVVRDLGLSTGQGFKMGGNPQFSADHLAGLPVLEIESVQPFRPPVASGDLFSKATLHRPRVRSQYGAPQVLIRRTLPEGRLAATVLLRDAVYSSELMSISGSAGDAGMLTILAMTIASSFGNYVQFMTSASWGIERGTVELNELLDMPVPLPTDDTGAAADLWLRSGRMDDASLLDAVDELIFGLFKLDATEVRRVREGLASGLARFDGGPGYDLFAQQDDLARYFATLVDRLRHAMPDLRVASGYRRDGPYVTAFLSFQEDEDRARAQFPPTLLRAPEIDTERILRSGAIGSTGTTGMVSLPAAFLIDEDTIYIVKTADSDRWTYDAALSDADRIFAALAFGG